MNTFDHDSAPTATDGLARKDDRFESATNGFEPHTRVDLASNEKESCVSGIEQLFSLEPDIVLEIVASGRGADSARGFRAVDALIRALGVLNGALTPWIRCDIENLALVENVGTHTVVGLLRHSVAATDPLRKHGLTAYLNRGTVEVVNWLNQLDRDEPLALARSIQRIAAIAAETEVDSERGFETPNLSELLEAAQLLNQARSALAPSDKALLSLNGVTIPLAAGPRLGSEAIETFAAAWRIENEGELLLVADSPDYKRNGRWGFLLDGRNIDATIEDSAWLSLFDQRTVEMRPGDVIRVLASTLSLYAPDGELISTRYTIKAVLELAQTARRAAPRL